MRCGRVVNLDLFASLIRSSKDSDQPPSQGSDSSSSSAALGDQADTKQSRWVRRRIEESDQSSLLDYGDWRLNRPTPS